MAPSINMHRIMLAFLAGLLLASIPVAFFWYFSLLMLLTAVFAVICILDFIQKKSMRKPMGLMLAFMFLAAIISVLAIYTLSYFNIT